MDWGSRRGAVPIAVGDFAHHAHAARDEEQRIDDRRRTYGGDTEGLSASTAHDPLGAPIECRHDSLRQKFHLLVRRVMALYLSLEGFDRGLAFSALRDHAKHAP